MTPRLITIPMSHFCEKARWAMDRSGVSYIEEVHAPLLSRLPAWRARAPGTVPVLIADEGVFGDSTDILGWVDRRVPLYAADARELEDRFDTLLAPAARCLAFLHVGRDRKLSRKIALAGVPRWERAVATAVFGAAQAFLNRRYGVTEEGGPRWLMDLRTVFEEVGARLADGRRYLCGAGLSAADLTFAALAGPVLLPASAKPGLPTVDEVPEGYRSLVKELRATAAGRFALRLYAEDR